MTSEDVLRMFPSRANYVLVKTRMVLIEKGFVLLKRKRDALEMKLRECRHKLDDLRQSSIKAIREALFCMARLNYLGCDLRHAPMLIYPNADVYLKISYVKLIGVTVPQFHIHKRDANCCDYTGLSRGGLELVNLREKFQFALEELTNYASVEYTVKVLHEGIRVNNMRVNGMEFILIPRYRNTLKYITEEIDEYNRQDFYRLKRSRARRIEKAKEEIADLRIKRDNPEEYERKLYEKKTKRYSLPHWKSIVTPKINVNIKPKYVVKKARRILSDRPMLSYGSSNEEEDESDVTELHSDDTASRNVVTSDIEDTNTTPEYPDYDDDNEAQT